MEEFSEAPAFEKVADTIIDKVIIHDINNPMRPFKIDGKMVHCPECSYVFEKASRCPECGQLINYEDIVNKKLTDADINTLYNELCECRTKKELVETWNKYGLKTATKPIDTVTIDDRYLQFMDGSRIQISATTLKLFTSDKMLDEPYFESVRHLAKPFKDGSYRIRRVTLEKSISNFKYIISYFIDNNYA